MSGARLCSACAFLRVSLLSLWWTFCSPPASCYNVPMPRMVKCAKLGRELPGLDEPPFDTELGQKIYANVSAEAWKMWAEHSKMLLNEYRLQPWKPEAQQFLVEQMQQYFFGAGAQLPKEFVPPPK
jgi:Fe-S cluster biosynthesis and repair protein YggX